MKKDFSVENLHTGMVIADNIYTDKHDVLIGKGTVLTEKLISSLLERPIFSVAVEVADDYPWHGPEKERHMLDNAYMEDYQLVYEELQMLFDGVSQYELDMSLIQQLFEEASLENLCNNGICAVTHIHNMTRSGKYLLHHSLNVGILAGLMGRWLRWPPERRHRLTIAGLFHDIGKLWIDQAILDKPSKLTDEEFVQIKNHPRTGYEFLCQTSLYDEKEILEGVLQHHERNDGTGYPDHLSQTDISDFGHILGILDVYDAMAADRSYAKRSSPFDIFEIIADGIKQGRLDAEYGVIFVRHLCQAMNGNWVLLTTGEKAKIIYIDGSRVNTLPVVQTENGDFIDLVQDNTVQVKMLLTYREQQE